MIQPILVDRESDSICFVSDRPPTDVFDVDILVPASLKLHHTIYDFVDTLLSTNLGLMSSIGLPGKRIRGQSVLPPEPEGDGFQPLEKQHVGPDDITVIFHDGSTPLERQAAANHFHESLQNLGTYDLTSLSTFFWSNPSTLDYFARNIISAEKENKFALHADRSSIWSSSLDYLNLNVKNGSQSGSVPDPCFLNTSPVISKEVSSIFIHSLLLLPYADRILCTHTFEYSSLS